MTEDSVSMIVDDVDGVDLVDEVDNDDGTGAETRPPGADKARAEAFSASMACSQR